MLTISPWWFGTTQPVAISAMNWAGLGLSLLLVAKWGLRRLTGYRPARWDDSISRQAIQLVRAVLGLTLLILGYMLASALNYRSIWQPDTQTFSYRECVGWLPHTYDRNATLQLLANYSALAGFFWALWDWLNGKTGEEQRAARRTFVATEPLASALPTRMRWLLWVLCLNGGLLALEAIIQRQAGTNKLLWLVVPHVNKDASTHWGPFAYRANGAQFLNLIWPVAFAFWLALQRACDSRGWRHHFVLLGAALMAAGPFISTARGGALVAAGLMFASAAFLAILKLIFPESRSSVRWKVKPVTAGMVAVFFLGVALLARNFGWDSLNERMTQIDSGLENRELIYDTARAIAKDYHWFGTGPGSLVPMYPLYRPNTDAYWPAQLHNDWLETRVTFGRLGFVLILTAFLLVVIRPRIAGGIACQRSFVGLVWLALLGALVHARFDFPFQIYSILMVSLTLCAVLLTVSHRRVR